MFIDTIGYNGGAERQFAGLACMLSDKGEDVHVVAYYPERGYFDMMKSHGVNVSITDFGNNKLSKAISTIKIFKKINPDIVISYKNGANVLACLAKLSGLRFKLIVSDRNTLQGISRGINFQYKLYRIADFIVPNSHSQARFINQYYPELTKKVNVITNFTDVDAFHPERNKMIRDKREIVVCGRITEQKNILNFIESVALLKSRYQNTFSLKWYGNVRDSDYFRKCRELITCLNIDDVFSFEKTRDDIDLVYRQADLFVLPSVYEGFPNVLCEAMASGITVVASRVCDNPDIVTEGKEGFLFNPLDPEDMAEKIGQALSMPDYELLRMGKNGRERILSMCSQEAFIKNYCKLF